jgi:restriction endonuclease S subunit
MEVKPGYKQTEVGVIPEEWEVRPIVELCEYQNGTSLEHLFTQDDGLKVISIGNYSVTGSYIDNGVHIHRKHRKQVEKFVLRRNDLTMSLNDKTSVGAIIGRVLLIQEDDLFVFNQRTMRLRPKHNVSPSYLHHAINADRVHGSIVGLAKPGTQIYVNTDDVIELRLATPPLPEQRAIAAALSDVDGLLGGLDRLIAKKRDLKQAAMQQLLTGQTRLPGFHGEWEIVTLGEILTLIADYTANGSFESLSLNVTYFQDDNYAALVRTTDLEKRPFSPERFTDKKGYDFLQKTSLVGGEIVIANVGSVGKAYRVPCFDKPMTLAPNTYLLRFDQQRVSDDYISHWMQSQDFVQKMLGKVGSTTLLAINKDNLRSIVTTRPPLPEQTAIASVLSEMDGELAVLEQRREKTRALKQAMMQELLTGRIRLV